MDPPASGTETCPGSAGGKEATMPVTAAEKDLCRVRYRQCISEAAAAHDWRPEIIAGIISRESRFGLLLDPRKPGGNPAGTGDNGHGHGLMQIDDRFHREFIRRGQWTDPAANIAYGVRVLTEYYDWLSDHAELRGDDLEAAAIAAYNCGPGNVRKSLEQGRHWDARTTGGDYSADVLARSAALKPFFPRT
jgi:membrane-bound lytic murein transglycosylase MltF